MDDVFRKRADLERRPPRSNGRDVALFNLAAALRNRFMKGGKSGDLDEAISLLHNVLELRPSGHRDRSSSLRELALCLLDRYDSQGAVADLEEAVKLGRAALELCLPGRPDRAVSLHNLACNLRKSFRKHSRVYDLEEAIQLHRAALELRPPGHPDRSSSLHWLALCLLNRYDSRGSVADLEEAVKHGRAALQLCPPGHPDRAVSLYNLACNLRTRFQKHARTYDLREAIQLHRAALELRPPGHRDRSSSLHWLALCLSDRYGSQGAVADLEEAVTLRWEALEVHLPGHPHRAVSLYSLTCNLRTRFQKHARMYDLEEAIDLHRAALELWPPGHCDRSSSLHGLALCLSDRYDSQGAVADLEEAVILGHAALELCPPGHPRHDLSVNHLAVYIRKGFRKRTLMHDLKKPIGMRRAALELLPPGHPDRPSLLRSLVLCLLDRYDDQGVVGDLEEAITLGRAALALNPPSHPSRASSLHDLAQCLAKRFRHLPIAADLDEAIALEQEALQLLTPGNPCYGVSRRCLTTYLELKIGPQVAVASLSAPGVMRVDLNQTIRSFAFDTLKTLPTRLLHTYSGVLCNRDAQLSHFMSSSQHGQLLSACGTCAPDQQTKLIHDTISGYFQFVMFSHRWGSGEPLLRDVEGHSVYATSTDGGLKKLQAFCLRACQQNYLWAWSDTCCIDKDSSVELQEAIASMFTCEWFRRGWTLQELLAPRTVLFYTQNWSLYKNLTGSNHKTNAGVMEELEKVTGIESRFLTQFSPGTHDARSRLQWASSRCTTRPEDVAYSLFGIFNVHLPVLYGEGAENALGRLLTEIILQSGDVSVLDWVGEASPFHSCFPAHITSYRTLPLTLSPDTDEQSLRMVRWPLLAPALQKLYRLLTESPLPQLINRRLTLPCITHGVTEVQLKGEDPLAPSYKYKLRASGLKPLEITLPNKLEDAAMKQGALQVVRPWNSKLLNPSAELDVMTEKRLLSMLGRPFHALLLIQLLHNEYKRIASSTLIVAEPAELASARQSRVSTLNVV
ncbi:hypothetical protein PISMIDRAFT_157857 [Pisolithus microcarpus 441]|uniref:Heterokaryon incompatibility domain-containing protein n=1 Tax=Pisolithus microcarpus 441 TaxID=765257 RepID=A0A0C9ZGV6_9AGAM|nr:hypothetical protein PISMIDRAFT_157857 [Pisolithus microcarpus 441]